MEIILRAGAKQRGLLHYFTGSPCKYGHVERRNTKDGSCSACNRFKLKLRNRIYAQKYAAEQRDRYAADPARVQTASKKWKDKNKARLSEYRLQRTKKDRLDRQLDHFLSSFDTQDKPW